MMTNMFNNTAFSDQNQCAIDQSFSSNTNWPYDWDGSYDDDNDGIINSNEILGCQDINACNYNSFATDPASCLYTDVNFRCSGETDGLGSD